MASPTEAPTTRKSKGITTVRHRPDAEFVGLGEAARRLDIAYSSLRRMISDGKLTGYRFGDGYARNSKIWVRWSEAEALMVPITGPTASPGTPFAPGVGPHR